MSNFQFDRQILVSFNPLTTVVWLVLLASPASAISEAVTFSTLDTAPLEPALSEPEQAAVEASEINLSKQSLEASIRVIDAPELDFLIQATVDGVTRPEPFEQGIAAEAFHPESEPAFVQAEPNVDQENLPEEDSPNSFEADGLDADGLDADSLNPDSLDADDLNAESPDADSLDAESADGSLDTDGGADNFGTSGFDNFPGLDPTALGDPELGNLLLRELEVPESEDPPIAFLLGGIDVFGSNNILLDDPDPVDDQLLRVGVGVFANPRLGPQTDLTALIEANAIRYRQLTDLNYNELRAGIGLRQYFPPQMYGELGFSTQHLFQADGGDRFLTDNWVQLIVVRQDALSAQWSIDSFYQLILSFSDPKDSSRVINTLGTSLNYDIAPDLQVGINYQLALTKFTQRERDDTYHQIVAQLAYNFTRDLRVIMFGGVSFGRSSDPDINFNSGIFGLSLDLTVPIF